MVESPSDAARRARIKTCTALAGRLAALTRELDRIEDSKGVGAAYYAKLDECTQARHELADALRPFLQRDDRIAVQTLREAMQDEPEKLRVIEQALIDDTAQYVDPDEVRHELFAVPVMLPRAFANTELSEKVRSALAQAWLRLNDNRDHDEDDVRITVLPRLLPPSMVEGHDEFSAFDWLRRFAEGETDDLLDDEAIRAAAGDDELEIEHGDGTILAWRFVMIHVATPAEWIDEDEPLPADDLRPFLPNFADLSKNYLDWSADARRALSAITRGPINVGFPDDLVAASVSGRYFAQFWITNYSLHRQLKAIDAESDAAQIAASLHRHGADANGKAALSLRIAVLDDEGDLLAGHVMMLEGRFTRDAAHPLLGDLALALSIDEQTRIPGIHDLPDEAPGNPLFHTSSGWRTLR